LRVVVALPDQENEYQLLQAADARATGARLGLTVEILDAKGHPVQQVHDLLKALHAEPRPKAVLVEPISNDIMETVARKAAKLGVGWVTLNSMVAHMDAVRNDHPGVPIMSVGSDQVEIGRVQGRHLRILLPLGGNVLYIHGPHNAAPAQDRFRGVSEVIGSEIKLTVVDGQWTEASAEAAVRSWLRLRTWEKTPIRAVAAQDDSMARGARSAIEALTDGPSWSSIPFLGIDGVPEFGQKLVDQHQLRATVVMPSNTGPALEHIERWVRTGRVPPARVRLPITSYPPEHDLVPGGVSSA
jgi:ribose transport system substrate-binding protein